MRFLLAAILALQPFVGGMARAELKLPPIFSDHMVLQRHCVVPVWGTADGNAEVSVRFAGQTKTTKADAGGKWVVKLDPMQTSAEGRELQVASGQDTLKCADVLVGEVWLGSGQSNMAFTVRSNKGLAELKAKANDPNLRIFNALERATDTAKTPPRSKWQVCTPETVESCSAVLYFFARRLQEKLDGVPVGVINASVGGTSIILWIDRERQMASPELQEAVERDEESHAKFDKEAAMKGYYASARYKDWLAAVEKAKAEGKPLPRQPYTPEDTYKGWLPAGTWFKTRIEPLIPYAIRGIVWYQGEADGSVTNGLRYRHQLPALIHDWRKRWGNPDMPFVGIQLPYWKPAASWYAVRESQLITLTQPHCGMVVTIDIGDPNDVHPNDKTEVGNRAAQWALGEVYGQKVETSGPLPAGHEIRDGEMVIRFTHAKGLSGKDGPIRGFAIAGKDRQWHAAKARVENDTVIVSSSDVTAPVAARYAWDGNPENCNLYNAAGLPASPFRTDDWELK